MPASTRARLRTRIGVGEQREPLLLPGAPNALTARVLQAAGFEAVYVSGAGVANTYLGVPDLGLLTLNEITAHVATIREAVSLPLVVDADTGFGNAINVQRSVRALERAGADAIQIEDQVTPKRCGHFEGKSVIGTSEMVGKVHAAVDARTDDDLLIIARTDARAVLGIEEACDRATRYVQAGADIAFVEAPRSRDEMATIIARVPGPNVANMVEGGVTPILPLAELGSIGYAIALYASTALIAAIKAMRAVAAELREAGDTLTLRTPVESWEERQGIVNKGEFDRLNELYGSF